MSRHTTTWEDDGLAGVKCDGVHVNMFLESGEQPEPCPRCGALLKLNWKVYISEVIPPAAAPGGEG